MTNVVGLVILFPMWMFCLSLALVRLPRLQKYVSCAGALVYTALAWFLFLHVVDHGPIGFQAGGWPSPFAISLRMDAFSALMIGVTAVIFLATSFYSIRGLTSEASNYFFPLLNILIAGVSGAFLTADLFNLYVWFEVILMSSFVLMSLKGGKLRLSGALKYVVLNFLSSIFFLSATALIYGAVQTLDFAEMSIRLSSLSIDRPAYVAGLGGFLFVAFAVKAALFPFFGWLPASYHHASPAVSAFFAGMLTKVGLYAIFRVSVSIFPASPYLQSVILVLAPATMLVGVLGAVCQSHIRRILSFHVISQVGYIALAGAFAACENESLRIAGMAAGIFYMLHHILVKSSLFFSAGIVLALTGAEELSQLGSLRYRAPLLSLLFALPALSLAGLPPFSGFWAKLSLLQSALSAGFYVASLVMIIAGFLTLFSMAKIWNGAFWSDYSPEKSASGRQLVPCYVATAFLVCLSLLIGFAPNLLMKPALVAANQLSPSSYLTGSEGAR